ncbi:hypothetical protein F1188_12865 [Roseospira marina]|uniref:YiaAB two helix domain-containing protein n=1 Tax=Roseospira marina TaxID=140057 RepID=A0A5M6IAD0_9PROT|nr:YiaA/YiaB family inner membrane protein [Roseospira marina]KAA5605163.1 hypothetical protein F1188_12865 [Roseospira marina]MBB4314920.1 hypothetical protein [Roseospira marina]MBB5087920.1 hypothetical protein [Roseospira marina]
MNQTEHVTAIMEPSKAWIIHSITSFAISLAAVLGGVLSLQVDFWVQGFLLMGVLFLAGNCFTLSKVLRDQHEARTWHHRLEVAKTRELIDKYADAA